MTFDFADTGIGEDAPDGNQSVSQQTKGRQRRRLTPWSFGISCRTCRQDKCC